MSSAESNRDRAARAQASFQLWLVNVFIGTLVGTLWLVHIPQDLSPWLWLYVPFALVSSVATLALMPGVLFFAFYRLVRSTRLAGLLMAFTGSMFLCIMYTDTIIYRLLRYHFNGAVLNVIATRGSEDAVHLGARVWGLVIVTMLAITAAQYALFKVVLRRAALRESLGERPPVLLRPRFVLAVVLLPAIFVEKSVYAAADMANEREVKYVAGPLPIYPQVRLSRLLDPEGRPLPRLDLLRAGSELVYPLAAPKIPPDGPRPNIMLLVVDSWRRDVFTSELTPHLAAHSERARVFEDHISGGNGTRYGVFSMLYGLHGSYWARVLEQRQPPVLMSVLQELGYDMHVFSSASMNFPEFRDTAWVDIQDNVIDGDGQEFPSNISSERDEIVANYFEEWLAERGERGDERPFFCFVLLDSPHQPYYNPGGPHQPAIEQLDYIELATETDAKLVERVFNRYKNSVLHADRVAGRILDALDASGECDDTVLVVTGDHGEEFQENGYWGHTSNFSPEQLDVPFYMVGPGIEPGRESRPTTHLDLSNSLLELLGADPSERADYSLGESLFDPPEKRSRVVAGWSDIGLWCESGIFRVPLKVDSDEVEVYDRHWRLQPDVEERCRVESAGLQRMAQECVRFLRQP